MFRSGNGLGLTCSSRDPHGARTECEFIDITDLKPVHEPMGIFCLSGASVHCLMDLLWQQRQQIMLALCFYASTHRYVCPTHYVLRLSVRECFCPSGPVITISYRLGDGSSPNFSWWCSEGTGELIRLWRSRGQGQGRYNVRCEKLKDPISAKRLEISQSDLRT